jgi:hypothetical protein
MTVIKLAGEDGALNATPSNDQFREQIAALVDAMRQLGGNASIIAGNLAQADPLSAPFTLYVNPYIGSDKFVGGSYNSFETGTTDEEIIASKLKRIEMQRLECGYTPFRPFKTINRAAIEAAIITSKDWYTYSDPKAHVDCVSIVLSTGVHIVYNDPGSSNTSPATWGETKVPTIAELISFNPASVGGVLLPRGCSLCGPDLRKTTIRPNYVPAPADEAADYSNRRSILKVTGTGYFFGVTGMDKIGFNESHHLLDLFGPASQSELDAFYAKTLSAVGSGADLASALTQTRSTEHEIVGPIDTSQAPTSAWDTTASASPYIFNCSIRSDYGLGGAFWDGNRIGGLKSMVCANFTGVSNQKDMRCWQVYESGNWVSLTNTTEDYEQYIDASPDDLRMNPARSTRHISAVNDAFIQEVSIFGIGQDGMNYTDNGGEITITNSNSTFGGCAAISKGYKASAFPKDSNWSVSRLKAPLNVSEKTSNIRRIYLGTVSAISGTSITLSTGLLASEDSTTVPAQLLAEGYTFANGTKVWVDNPVGPDWRATLTSSAWSSSAPSTINITSQLLESGNDAPVGTNPQGSSLAIGRRVYIRRIVDTRPSGERRISLLLNNTASSRLPQRNFTLQTDPARSGGAISRVLNGGGSEVLLVSAVGVGPTPGSGVTRTSEITIRRGAADRVYQADTYYRVGTVVRYANKHWQAKQTMVSSGSSPDPSLWGEIYVHMPSDFNPEDSISNEAPTITFDTDTSDSDTSTTLGINWTSVWTNAGPVRDQYRSGTDYLGAYALLRALGFTESAAHDALVPRASASRLRDPNSSLDFPVAPSGGAAIGLGYWAVEFRRPSMLRLYGHAWEWAGFRNYSKALPAAQQDMSEFNKFTYYFTNIAGGRVIPQGSNEDGFNITPRGLEDIETGATTTLENLSGQDLDAAQAQDFNNINVLGEATIFNLAIENDVEFPDLSSAKIDKLGPVKLASYAEVVESVNPPTAGSDADIEGNPDVVTIRALNRWKIAQKLVSTSTDTIPIYVKAGTATKTLDQMIADPPTSPSKAIPTLALASDYANSVIGGGNQTAEIRMAPGLYNPSSVWTCNAKFVAYTANFAGLKWPSNSVGTNTVENNYFDGSGYDDFTGSVNFYSFFIVLRPSADSSNQFHFACIPLNMRFGRGFDFQGGFHFLGLPHLIKAVAQGNLPAATLIGDSTGFVYPPSGAYTTDTSTNVDTLLNGIYVANSRSANYQAYTESHLFVLLGQKSDSGTIRDCVFGSGLPSRKDSLGGTRSALVSVQGTIEPRIANIYFRGKTKITTAGMFAGVSNASIGDLPQAGDAHYGSSAVSAPWTWEQTYHTFIAPAPGDPSDIALSLGGDSSLRANLGTSFNTWSYYQDQTGKLLPNHIQLLTTSGQVPANDNTGPFFDQFVHAPSKFATRNVWQSVGETLATPGPRLQGFVGKFGSNGYNSVKTRGVLGGNLGVEDPEAGFTFSLSPGSGANGGKSIFQKAGIAAGAADSTARPTFDSVNATDPGEGYPDTPTIENPVITTDGSAGLNVGLRSFKQGISVDRAIIIPNNNVIL